ncbi:hypothetical protein EVG20_g2569 [Dentipellis fragilis]|uniref:F-box domain-containing protein n=1 Tax=Dentipellis fragilis TaxID=205917 RepID=A0A4Y9Z8J4_9AGAM|nr:hypothetical protein EVG20_g2569 [Dentipellis fragilis]
MRLALVAPRPLTLLAPARPVLNNVLLLKFADRSTEEERSRLHHELDLAIKLKSDLRARINALNTVCRLPAEVLVKIFRYLPELEYSYTRYKEVEGKQVVIPRALNLGWILVTHVCKYWRRVALEKSGLWTRICFSLGSEWAAQMMERSKTAPLTIADSYETRKFHPHVGRLTSSHLSHTRKLHFYLPLETLTQLLSSLVDAAPILHKLCLLARSGSVVMVSKTFLDQHSPNLREMTLRNVSIPLTSSLFRKLEHLEMEFSVGFRHGQTIRDPPCAPTLPGLLDMLRTMLGMKVLKLSQSAIPAAATATPGLNSVSLPSLVSILLAGWPADMAALLTHVELPRVASFSLGDIHGADTGDYQALFSALSTHLSRSGGQGPLAMTGLKIRDQVIKMAISGHRGVDMPNNFYETAENVFTIEFHAIYGRMEKAIPAFLTTLPLQDLVSLKFVGMRCYPVGGHWRDALHCLPNIRFLEVYTQELDAILEFLREGTEEAAIFPHLEMLSIRFVYFSTSKEEKQRRTRRLLSAVLRMRWLHGHPLQKLELRGDGPDSIDADWLARLRRLVAEVVVEALS